MGFKKSVKNRIIAICYKYRGSTVNDQEKKTKERKVGNMEKKSRMIHEYMETICTDRKKNHVARRAPRAHSALSCEENREKNMSRGSWRAGCSQRQIGLILP